MKTLLLVAALAFAAVSADVSHLLQGGYNYDAPTTTFDQTTQYQQQNVAKVHKPAVYAQQGYQASVVHNTAPAVTSSQYNYNTVGTGGQQEYYQTGSQIASGFQSVPKPNAAQSFTGSGSFEYNRGFENAHKGGQAYQQQQYVYSQQEPIIKKHYYLHVAPEEEVHQTRQQIVIPPPEKHYKIIFVKAPTYETRAQQLAALQPQIQEKTIVYVLVKKPEDIANLEIPTPGPTEPTKPEVYFIKYKSNKKQNNVDVLSGISQIGGTGPIDEETINAELEAAGGLQNIAGSSYYNGDIEVRNQGISNFVSGKFKESQDVHGGGHTTGSHVVNLGGVHTTGSLGGTQSLSSTASTGGSGSYESSFYQSGTKKTKVAQKPTTQTEVFHSTETVQQFGSGKPTAATNYHVDSNIQQGAFQDVQGFSSYGLPHE